MEFDHTPVLPEECLRYLNIRPEGIYVDGTLGGAGHSSLICGALSERGQLIGIDRDEDALRAAGERLKDHSCQIHLVHDNYTRIGTILAERGIEAVDGALLDLGVSSFQLDAPERGFSYMRDAPLDMRMDQRQDFTAFDVVNGYSEKELCRVIREYGEERWASRISRFIVRERESEPIRTSSRLVEIIKSAMPASARREGPHPAKRTFQAIRIEVNGELEGLKEALTEFCDALAPGGRFCVITFHSLEDRIVKECFRKREDPCECPPGLPCVCGKVGDVTRITRKPVCPSKEEMESNPRARSAKLRVIEKIEIGQQERQRGTE